MASTTTILNSCKKDIDDLKKTNNNETSQVNRFLKSNDPEDDHDEVDTNYIVPIAKETNFDCEITYAVFNGMLHFETKSDFLEFIECLGNKSDSVLVANTFNITNFTSLREHYDDLSANIYVDDLELIEENERLVNSYFEALINSNRKIRIQDTVYHYEENFVSVDLYLVSNEEIGDNSFRTTSLKNLENCFCENQGVCVYRQGNYRIPTWSNSNMEVGAKAVEDMEFYKSISYSSIHMKKNEQNNWKFDKRPFILNTIDEHYRVSYWLAIWESPNSQSIFSPYGISKTYFTINSERITKIIAHNIGYAYCISEFGRTHNWSEPYSSPKLLTNWYDDVHVENWVY